MKEKTIIRNLNGRGKTFAVSLKAFFKILGATTTESKKAVANSILDILKVELLQAGITGIRTLDVDSSKANYVVINGDLLTIHLTSLPTGENVLKISARYGTEAMSLFSIHLNVKDGATGVDSTESLEFNVSELLSECSAADIDLLKTKVATLEDEMDTVQEAFEYAGDSWLTYGVVHRLTEGSPDLVRVGNMDLHRSLPVQSLIRRCVVKDDGTVNYYLDDHNSALQADGETPAVLDGTDGQVMVEIPHHYRKHTWNAETQSFRTDISLIPFTGALEIPQRYISAYGATVQRSTNKLSCVVNNDADYRGGNNTAAWDADDRSLLGKRATNINLTNFRTYAQNRGANWGCSDYSIHMDVVWLLVIEYATLNSQKAYNSVLDTNGCRQGCLGDGVSNLNGTAWSNWNGYNPFISSGYTNSLGNLTGVKSFTMPYGYDTKVAGAAYTYAGAWDAETAYTNTNTVSVANGDLYKCIAAGGSTGENPTSTPSSWTKVTRTTTSVNSYRGIENLFGEVWNITDGYLQQYNADTTYLDTFICRDHTKYASSVTSDYTLMGHNSLSDGYVKTSDITEYGDFLPRTVGASPSTYFCDYYYQAHSAGTTYALFVGGRASSGATDGVFCFDLSYSVSFAHAFCGSRLCCFGAV